MAVEEGLRRLPRIGLDEPDVGMGQDQAEEGDLLTLPPQLHHRLAEVDLGMARRVVQWHEGLARRLPPGTHIVLHDGIAAGEPVLVAKIHKTSDEIVAEVDRLLNDHTVGEIATTLNQRGYRSGYGHAFNPMLVRVIRDKYALKSRHERLRERGLLTALEAADRFGVSDETVYRWHKAGLLRGHAYNDRPGYLFEIPDPPPTKQPGRSPKQGRSPDLVGQRSIEAQYET